jgi:hypothetical protein
VGCVLCLPMLTCCRCEVMHAACIFACQCREYGRGCWWMGEERSQATLQCILYCMP